MRDAGVEKFDDLDQMLAASDFVSIHCVLNDATRYLIGAPQLASMKRSAILINVSRGAIVDEQALVAAIVGGRIGGAASMSMRSSRCAGPGTSEPAIRPRQRHPVPALTFFTHEAMRRLEEDTLARCFEIADGHQVTVRSNRSAVAGADGRREIRLTRSADEELARNRVPCPLACIPIVRRDQAF